MHHECCWNGSFIVMETFWHDLTGWTARTFVIKRAKLALKYSSSNEANHLRLIHLTQKESQKEISTIQVSLKGIANHTKGGGGGQSTFQWVFKQKCTVQVVRVSNAFTAKTCIWCVFMYSNTSSSKHVKMNWLHLKWHSTVLKGTALNFAPTAFCSISQRCLICFLTQRTTIHHKLDVS